MFSNLYLREVRLNKESHNHTIYPFNLPVVSANQSILFTNQVTFIIGPNGSGKSTLIEAMALAYGFNAEGGTINYRFSTNDTHSNLYEYITLVKGIVRPRETFFFRAESFYTMKTYLESIELRYGEKPMHHYSHGESFLVLMMEKFTGRGLYILDEPESALSPQSQLALLSRMNQLETHNSQFIIATHSPILLAYPNATIYQIGDGGELTQVDYEDTEYYQIYKYFMNNYQRMIERLMA